MGLAEGLPAAKAGVRGLDCTGDVAYFTIRAPLVPISDCGASWAMVRGESTDVSLRELSGVAAVVTYKSKMILRKAVEHCDTYLLRELDYTHQFSRLDKDREYLAYLWIDLTAVDATGRAAVLGACCFRNRHYKDYPYAMQWVWFHPYARRQGHLRAAWPYFEKRFGPFVAEGPYSEAMVQFLKTKTRYNDLLVAAGLKPL
jgi:hypothetical protein